VVLLLVLVPISRSASAARSADVALPLGGASDHDARARSLLEWCRSGTTAREPRSSAASPGVPRTEDVTSQTLGNTETRVEWRVSRAVDELLSPDAEQMDADTKRVACFNINIHRLPIYARVPRTRLAS
jgi:hypothetical protein